jgi:hypothetical protein
VLIPKHLYSTTSVVQMNGSMFVDFSYMEDLASDQMLATQLPCMEEVCTLM